METVNFMELFAIDQKELLCRLVPTSAAPFPAIESPRLSERMKAGGAALLDVFGSDFLGVSAGHKSDTIRSWGAMAVGLMPVLDISERLEMARTFATDPHFSVREWAWISVRPQIASELDDALEVLGLWAESPEPFIRRFASESTRPRGVWCRHIPRLKDAPDIAAHLLEPLRADPERYVQLSVGNWMNDAAKSRSDWVVSTTDRWTREDRSAQCSFICKRALRSLK
jgi:3-methyladenine DNA glycosylase AlkC